MRAYKCYWIQKSGDRGLRATNDCASKATLVPLCVASHTVVALAGHEIVGASDAVLVSGATTFVLLSILSTGIDNNVASGCSTDCPIFFIRPLAPLSARLTPVH